MKQNAIKRICLLGLVLFPTVASAQGRSGVATQVAERNDVYVFRDDLLNAKGMDASGAILRVRVNTARAGLVRPRVSFVPALVKSVETLP